MPDDKPCLPIRPNQVTCNRGTYGCGMQRPPARPTTSAALSDMLLGLAHDCYAGGMSSADIYKGFEKAVGVLSTGGSSQPPALDMADLIDAMNEVLRISDREHEAWGRAKAGIAKLQAHPEGHSCVFHAVPLRPGDTQGPQTAACATCGEPPSVLAAQPAAAVSDAPTDEQIAAGMRELFAGPKPWPSWEATLKRVYQAMSALRPQAVPMTEDKFVACLVKANCIGVVKMSYDSGPYYVTRPSINASKLKEAIEAHYGITQRADGGEG